MGLSEVCGVCVGYIRSSQWEVAVNELLRVELP